MPIEFDLVTIDVADDVAMATFWSATLNLEEIESEDGGRWRVFGLRHTNGSTNRRLGLQRIPQATESSLPMLRTSRGGGRRRLSSFSRKRRVMKTPGEVRERPNRTHSKCVVLQGTVGSNPTLSAMQHPEAPQRTMPRANKAGASCLIESTAVQERSETDLRLRTRPSYEGPQRDLQAEHGHHGALAERSQCVPLATMRANP
jgi:hypothetical protein